MFNVKAFFVTFKVLINIEDCNSSLEGSFVFVLRNKDCGTKKFHLRKFSILKIRPSLVAWLISLSRQTVVAIILLEKKLFYDGLSGMTGENFINIFRAHFCTNS